MHCTEKTPVKLVYFAEDDKDDIMILDDVFSEIDRSVIIKHFTTGDALIKSFTAVGDSDPDILFLDLNLPVKSGFECLKELRSMEFDLKKILIIVYSSSSEPEIIAQAFALGASHYVVKPSDYSTLKKLIRKILKMDICFSNKKIDDFLLFS